MVLNSGGYSLKELKKINIILGRNGCGKSVLLRELDKNVSGYSSKRYISPERSGTLSLQSSIEQNISNNPQWLIDERRKNQSSNFKYASYSTWKELQLLIYKKYHDSNGSTQKIDDTIKSLNDLLENIKFESNEKGFKLKSKTTNEDIPSDKISSGESELVTLGIEILHFFYSNTNGLLLLDEPDVHLHPDLQSRLANLLVKLVSNNNSIIIIATHSTAFLAALSTCQETSVTFMSSNQKILDFLPINNVAKKFLPIFGTHPMSQIFIKSAPFIVEGDDDVRIWNQVCRSTQGKFMIYLIEASTVNKISEYEDLALKIMSSIYENPICYSLRDEDGNGNQDLDDKIFIKRMRLKCYSAENLLLAEEVLFENNISWDQLTNKFDTWLNNNSTHVKFAEMSNFKVSGYDRKNFKIKEVRNIIVAEIGSNKPWEILIGQTIAKRLANKQWSSGGHCLKEYLGDKLFQAIDVIYNSP